MSPQRGIVSVLASLLLPVSCSVAGFTVLYVLFFSHIWGDQAFLLYAAKEVLSGVRLDGPRLIETNPPLIVWFSTLPVLLAHLLRVSPTLMLQLVTLALLEGSSFWSWRMLRLVSTGVPPFIGAAVIFAAEVAIRPALFGQREQIFLALAMPYLVAMATGSYDALSKAERCAMGMCAGLAVCFKPHQVLTLIVIELFLALTRRTFRHLLSVEVIAATFTGIVYVACVSLFTPYLSTIVPLLRDTYWALGSRTFASLLLHEECLLTIAVVLAAAAWLLLRTRLKHPQFPGVFLAAALGATGAVYVQHTGWGYQAFPATGLVELGVLFMVMEWVAARLPEELGFVPPSWIAWLVVLILLTGGLAGARRKSMRDDATQGTIDADMAQYPANTVVYAFSMEMSQFRVILEHNLVWGSRFAHLWMLPAIVQNEVVREDSNRPFKALSTERAAQLASLQRSETTEDLAAWKPQYVYVEKCDEPYHCDLFDHSINFITWFSADPAFAQEWSHYRLLKTIRNFDVYQRQ